MEEPFNGTDGTHRIRAFSQLPVWAWFSSVQDGVHFNSITTAALRNLRTHCSMDTSRIGHASFQEPDVLGAFRLNNELSDTSMVIHDVGLFGRDQPSFHGISLRNECGFYDDHRDLLTCLTDEEEPTRLAHSQNNELSRLYCLPERYQKFTSANRGSLFTRPSSNTRDVTHVWCHSAGCNFVYAHLNFVTNEYCTGALNTA
jgi:hypothetical protein